MDLKLSEFDVIDLLKVVREEYWNSKGYYSEHLVEEERIGITSPEEWKELYNNIVNQLDNKVISELFKQL